uniref:Reverse transcriptase domain-containing protein n=1 Tax=Trichuris muris TaxID=70415 RepID=A0A5S6R5T4_TRIMR
MRVSSPEKQRRGYEESSLDYAVTPAAARSILPRTAKLSDGRLAPADRVTEEVADVALALCVVSAAGRSRRRARALRSLRSGKREWGRGVGATLFSPLPLTQALRTAQIDVNGVRRSVLVYTGCSKCSAHVSCCGKWRKAVINMVAVDGREFQCEGISTVRLRPPGGAVVHVQAVMVRSKPFGFEFILGMNGITALGGMIIDDRRHVQLRLKNPSLCGAVSDGLKIEERDFSASFDPVNRSWTAAWKWSEGAEPGALRNTMEEYPPAEEARTAYEEELDTWIDNGWLVPYNEEEFGPPKGLIPPMAVVQPNKSKERPVMDFRELNDHIETFTADTDICAQKMREWRREGPNVAMIDLTKAYHQIRIDKSLWPYQTVVFLRRRYCLTRLGFSLNVAPLIMKAVVSRVLSQDQVVERGTSTYTDDILVNENVVKARRVEEHLARYGLTCKPHEHVVNGAHVLGLKVLGLDRKLVWKRDNPVPRVSDRLTRRSVFSYCSRLVGNLPVCGWFRIAAAFVKRKVNSTTTNWDEVVNDVELWTLLTEIADEVRKRDPAHGMWNVAGDHGRVWVDANSLAIGIAIEADGSIIEDAVWLWPDDARSESAHCVE